MNPRISVVIPARNDAAALARTVEWLRHLPGIREAELIVAASGDPPGTMHALRGMNAGAASALGEILFFVHADPLPPMNVLALIDRALSDDRVVGGAFGHRFAESRWSFFIVWLLLLHSLRLDTARYAERWRGPADLSPGSPWPSDRRRTGTWQDAVWEPVETHRRGLFPSGAVEVATFPSPRRTAETHAARGRR